MTATGQCSSATTEMLKEKPKCFRSSQSSSSITFNHLLLTQLIVPSVLQLCLLVWHWSAISNFMGKNNLLPQQQNYIWAKLLIFS